MAIELTQSTITFFQGRNRKKGRDREIRKGLFLYTLKYELDRYSVVKALFYSKTAIFDVFSTKSRLSRD